MKRALFLSMVVAPLALWGCATLVKPAAPLPKNAIPPVVAVSSFENRSGFEGEWELGSGMADLLVSELVSSRNFVIVERKDLGSVVGELDRQRDRRFRAEGKAGSGRLKNARYLVRGVVTDFSQVGGGSLMVAVRSLFFGGRGYTARVSLTLTIVDIESGEIVDSVQCAGLARAREAYGKGAYRGVHFAGDTFFKTPLGIATVNAIRSGVKGIVEKAPRVYWEPMIAAVDERGRIVLNGGEDRGIRKDASYEVLGEGKVITDPVTGDPLSIIEGPVLGAIRVTEAGEKIAYAETLLGGPFARGQRLRIVKER